MTFTVPITLEAVVHEAAEGGFWAEVPALPGCFTQAETKQELLANLREAAQGCLEVELEDRAAAAVSQKSPERHLDAPREPQSVAA